MIMAVCIKMSTASKDQTHREPKTIIFESCFLAVWHQGQEQWLEFETGHPDYNTGERPDMLQLA